MSNTEARATVQTRQLNGVLRIARLLKRKSSCSGIKRICTICQVRPIHPNDACYGTGVCFTCHATAGARPLHPRCGLPVGQPASRGEGVPR